MATGRHDLKVLAGGRTSRAVAAVRSEDTTAKKPDPEPGSESETAGPGPVLVELRELYSRYGASVYGRCRYLLKDAARAEDAMQDVFAKVLTNVEGFRAEASPLTWLTKIATNHCLNLLRAERAPWRKAFEEQELAGAERAHHGIDGGGSGGGGGAGGDGHGRGWSAGPKGYEDRELVRQLLAGVDLETQAAAIHYHVDEMTLEEVAAALGRSVPTVRKRLAEFAALAARRQAQDARLGRGGWDDRD